eukprot:144424-Pelagomonas_calceolata.AAC.2
MADQRYPNTWSATRRHATSTVQTMSPDELIYWLCTKAYLFRIAAMAVPGELSVSKYKCRICWIPKPSRQGRNLFGREG